MQMRCNERNLLAIESCGGETQGFGLLTEPGSTWRPALWRRSGVPQCPHGGESSTASHNVVTNPHHDGWQQGSTQHLPPAWHCEPQFLYPRPVGGCHLISEPVKHCTGDGLQLSATGSFILVSCGAMLLLH